MSDVATTELPPLCDGSQYRWFDSIPATQGDPWESWLFYTLPSPGLLGRSQLEYPIEADIEDALRAADQLRLSIVPTTKHFTEMWAMFRRHHDELDMSDDRRRSRYFVWRAAALKEMCDRDSFQDEADKRQAHKKLAATLHEFGPYNADGSVNKYDCNFWRPAGPLGEYTSMVFLLMQQSRRQRLLALYGNLKCLVDKPRINDLINNKLCVALSDIEAALYRINREAALAANSKVKTALADGGEIDVTIERLRELLWDAYGMWEMHHYDDAEDVCKRVEHELVKLRRVVGELGSVQ